ncbi:MAG: alanine racemase [Bacteroidales bacterium]|nr:alanine racemase [Candidatus Cacconaster caballi]
MTIQTPHAQLELSKSGMLHNYKHFRSKLKDSTKMLILVKANGYGHGAVDFARVMEEAGADYLGVAFPVEGVELKKAGIKLPVLVLTSGTENYPEIIEYGLEPGMPNIEALRRLRDELRKAGRTAYPVHIKLDTGMHRLGFMEKDLPALLDFLRETPEIKVQSIYSHLAASDESQHDEFTLGQIALYEKMSSRILEVLPYRPIRHILNSAGIERFTEYQYDMVRLGVGIYGISAVDDSQLRPAAALRCPILQIKELGAEDGTVGYGRHGKLGPGIKHTATICVGYADGVNRHLGRGNAKFCVNGKLVPTIGNICMDMCMVDVTGVDAKVGDTVTIFGENPSARDLAGILDTIPYEIFTSVAKRIKRVVVE